MTDIVASRHPQPSFPPSGSAERESNPKRGDGSVARYSPKYLSAI
jgi:hypothetical protein